MHQCTMKSSHCHFFYLSEYITCVWNFDYMFLFQYPSRPGQPSVQPTKLQFLNTVTLKRDACLARLGSLGQFFHVNSVCTTNPINKGICLGDTGNPLVTARRELVGIASWAIPCARGYPDVFTRVFPYLEWIEKTIAS